MKEIRLMFPMEASRSQPRAGTGIFEVRETLASLPRLRETPMFVIDLASRRVQIPRSKPHPAAAFIQQIVRTLTMAEPGAVPAPHISICDRDRKWTGDVRRRLWDAGFASS